MATKKPAVPGIKAVRKTAVPAQKKVLLAATAKPKATPSPKKTLPTLAEYKQSAAYKTGSMTYKQYLDSFKARGYK